jgi:TonB-linked SusC/RagA family outer membrane protein
MKLQLLWQRGIALTAFFLFLYSPQLTAQQPTTNITVTGKVSDENGKALDGATIEVKGTLTSTLTKADGTFSISAPPRSKLVITTVGYTPLEIDINNRKSINVSMHSSVGSMDEVVVVGYGTAKRRDVTSAVASFNPKGIEERPVGRIDQAMIGQMAGVQVRQQTGMPGQGYSLVVRGSGSISGGTEPLYVIDGFPLDVQSQNTAGGFSSNPLNNLNPDDIESIQVLKDAAAGAIYGSRAANGVVLITTKRGQIGKARIGINANTGSSQVAKKMDMLNASEWISLATELANAKWVASGTGRTADQTNDQRRAILGLAPGAYNTNFMPDDRWTQPGHPGLRYVDWQDESFRAAPFQNYEVSASGGTDAVRYFFSGSYLNQAGVLLNSGYKNYSARANVEVNASKKFKVGINLAPTYSETNSPLAEGKDNQLHHIFNMTPIVEDTAGLLSGAGKNSVYSWASSSVSPVAFLNNTINFTKMTRLLYSMYGEYTIIPGLSIKSTLNYDEVNNNFKRYISDYVAGNIANYLNSPGKSSSGTYNGYKKQNFVTENTLNYYKTIGGKHYLSAVAGMSYSYNHIESYTLSTAGGFANDDLTTLNNAIASTAGVTVTGNTTESNNTMLSYYGRVSYSYLDRYLVTGSFRGDAASRFGAASRWGYFPSVSAGWRMSEESFMKNITWLNDLKLRASWGRAGSSNIGDYQAIPTLVVANYSFGGTAPVVAPGEIPNGLPNPNLHWETSNTYDGGFDATLFNSRVNVIVDYYVKHTTDLFLNVPVLAASGFTSGLTNIGSVINKGLEFTFNTVNMRTKDFQWTTSANIAFNKNRVDKLGLDGAPINVPSAYGGNPPFLLQIGTPMFDYYLVQTIGVLNAKDVADATVAKLPSEVVGDAKYLDVNKDGRIDASDRVLAGQPNPKYTWGITNTFRYKAFDLSFQFYGQQGGHIFSFLARATDNPANGRNTTQGVWRDRWTAANPNDNAPRGKISESYTIPLFTTDWLYSSDFWRLQNITLGYNLKSAIRGNFLNNARIYVSVLNWFGHDKYTGGVNPEAQNTNVSGSGSFPLPGDYGAMPLNKSITFGVNLGF